MENRLPINFKKGISTFQIIILLIVCYYIWDYVQDNFIYKDTPKYLVEFKNAINDFSTQKDTVKKTYQEAIEAKEEAKKIKYVFKNESTKEFIRKWEKSQNEVAILKEKFEVYKEETENFIDKLDENLEQIKNDEALKERMKEFSKNKAKLMAKNIINIEHNIEKLDNSITKGNNLIVALKTVSSFNLLSEDAREFDSILNDSSDIFVSIDSLVSEGIKVLDDELK
jgi:predicted RNase H-like nuclease (RuvC/YqgF family)